MKFRLTLSLVSLFFSVVSFAQTSRPRAAKTETAPKPKLVVLIVVDQFRYDYLTRFRSSYTGGLNQLLTSGAVFTNARLIHFPTVTAIGHSTTLSGAPPSVSGIIGNDWYDRESKSVVTSVSDATVPLLGAAGKGSSPRRLQVSTVGDEMRIVNQSAKVIGISLKDRAAILPVGRMANGAYWFDGKSGNFVSSTWYFPELPGWVRDFNASHAADRFAGSEWMGKKFGPPGEALNESLAAAPWGNELIETFAERAVASEKLGQNGWTDLLSVSFSSNDYVGHAFGPDSPQVKDMALRTDQLFQKFFTFLNGKVGMRNVIVILTADHGVVPVPEVSIERKMPGGRMGANSAERAIQAALEKNFGVGSWISASSEGDVFLNTELIAQKKLERAEVDRVAADAARAVPHIFRVFTREQMMDAAVYDDSVGMRVMNGFNSARSGDLFVIQDPYWLPGAGRGTSHGTPFGYDTHIPMVFMGPGIKPGKYHGTVAMNDIAPTLATVLGVEIPGGSIGRVLAEMFTKDLN